MKSWGLSAARTTISRSGREKKKKVCGACARARMHASVVSVDFAITIGDGSRPFVSIYTVLIIDTRLLLRCSGVLASLCRGRTDGRTFQMGESLINVEEGAPTMTLNKITIANGCLVWMVDRNGVVKV